MYYPWTHKMAKRMTALMPSRAADSDGSPRGERRHGSCSSPGQQTALIVRFTVACIWLRVARGTRTVFRFTAICGQLDSSEGVLRPSRGTAR